MSSTVDKSLSKFDGVKDGSRTETVVVPNDVNVDGKASSNKVLPKEEVKKASTEGFHTEIKPTGPKDSR